MKKYICFVVILFGLSGIGFTHELRPAYLELSAVSDQSYSVLFKVPGRGPQKRLALYLQLPEDTKFITPAKTTFTGRAFIERSTIKREGGLAGAEIGILGLSKTLTDALVRIEFNDGGTQTVRLTPQSPSFIVQDSPDKMEVIKTYFALGVEHILLGIDHLLFLLCLLIIAKTARRILITVTGFTIAHSITLILSALNIINIPVPPVEAVIALSIVFVAYEIARGAPDTFTYKYPVLVSASFGLLHGFGFASALKNIGLPQTEIAVSLLFFNVGVEIGQLVFISAIVILIFVLKKILNRSYDYFSNFEIPAAYVIGSLACFWMIERIYSFWF
jgi:hydrogenase/urease accessory protein HupE